MTCVSVAVAVLLGAHAPVPYDAEIDAALADTAAIYPVPKVLVIAVISVESGFRPRAVSRAGAKGLMQLMPYTAQRVGIAERDLFDPARNVLGGVRLLAVLLRHYDGDVIATLVAYNARPRRLFAPIPRNGETPTYVWRVLARARLVDSTFTSPCGRPRLFDFFVRSLRICALRPEDLEAYAQTRAAERPPAGEDWRDPVSSEGLLRGVRQIDGEVALPALNTRTHRPTQR